MVCMIYSPMKSGTRPLELLGKKHTLTDEVLWTLCNVFMVLIKFYILYLFSNRCILRTKPGLIEFP